MALFLPSRINSMPLNNRAVRSATWLGGTNDQTGEITEKEINPLVQLAKGEVGLIITGFAYVSLRGRHADGMIGIHSDHVIPSLARLVQSVHDARPGVKICLQIVHAGRVVNQEDLNRIPGYTDLPESERSIWGVSDFDLQDAGQLPPRCHAMTIEEIAHVIDEFAQAARRARMCGFDAVQIHGAHGFLLSQFISPYWNRRSDAYGGSPENRCRFATELVQAMRQQVGPDFPLLMKINTADYIQRDAENPSMEQGLAEEEALAYAAALHRAGLDAIETSGGCLLSPAEKFPIREGTEWDSYYAHWARLAKERVPGLQVVLTGGVRRLDLANEWLTCGACDFVGFSRPLMREPHLIKRWREGDPSASKCRSCGHCFDSVGEGRDLECFIVWKQRESKEKRHMNQGTPE